MIQKKSSKLETEVSFISVLVYIYIYISSCIYIYIYIYIYICDSIIAKASRRSQDSHSFRSALTNFSTLDPIPEDTCFLQGIR